jgi:two-component system nitrate/nitrite response regulator NarL
VYHDQVACVTVRVLVVDDEPDVVLLLRLQLGMTDGFEVVGTAADGAEAIEAVRAEPPDAVVMDLLMPKLNGFEAIARIQEEFPDVALVAYSGVAGDFVRQEMTRRDVPIVLKSGDPAVLIAAVRGAVGRKKSPN